MGPNRRKSSLSSSLTPYEKRSRNPRRRSSMRNVETRKAVKILPLENMPVSTSSDLNPEAAYAIRKAHPTLAKFIRDHSNIADKTLLQIQSVGEEYETFEDPYGSDDSMLSDFSCDFFAKQRRSAKFDGHGSSTIAWDTHSHASESEPLQSCQAKYDSVSSNGDGSPRHINDPSRTGRDTLWDAEEFPHFDVALTSRSLKIHDHAQSKLEGQYFSLYSDSYYDEGLLDSSVGGLNPYSPNKDNVRPVQHEPTPDFDSLPRNPMPLKNEDKASHSLQLVQSLSTLPKNAEFDFPGAPNHLRIRSCDFGSLDFFNHPTMLSSEPKHNDKKTLLMGDALREKASQRPMDDTGSGGDLNHTLALSNVSSDRYEEPLMGTGGAKNSHIASCAASIETGVLSKTEMIQKLEDHVSMLVVLQQLRDLPTDTRFNFSGEETRKKLASHSDPHVTCVCSAGDVGSYVLSSIFSFARSIRKLGGSDHDDDDWVSEEPECNRKNPIIFCTCSVDEYS